MILMHYISIGDYRALIGSQCSFEWIDTITVLWQ